MYCPIILGSDKTTVSVATGKLNITHFTSIFQGLKPNMTTPVVRQCPDGHFRRIIFGFGPFIADYPEQVMLAGMFKAGVRTFTNDFPRANIYGLLSPDILHQLIKGTFKDHLVDWVEKYLRLEHGKVRAEEIMDDIDERLAAVPLFPELRRFPHGRRFKQWTGDDSKALMKVYLPALVGYVPSEMLKCFSGFLDFCYIARRPSFTEKTLNMLENALERFHTYREIFRTSGVRPTGFSLPRQHSLPHYRFQIEEYGAPGGLCSSITESHHITTVKKPWRRSSRYEALGQMLITNQRLDKLSALRADFVKRVSSYPHQLEDLTVHIRQPMFPVLVRRFLYDQLYPESQIAPEEIHPSIARCSGKFSVVHSAVATYFAPRGAGFSRDECRPYLAFFFFTHLDKIYPCALVEWFEKVGQRPDDDTGLWIVRPDVRGIHQNLSFCYPH
ncbi:hypothetical protein BD779DRAFT_1614206 [Infundibulicybe gibba]|nr:hypothetical protein BD779DRAFT_1614206 [Infundibulicybe gibba]